MTAAGTPTTPATINRWRNSEPKPARVTAFALAYGRPVLEAFVAAGYLTAEQAGAEVPARTERPLRDLSVAELLAELQRKVGQAPEVTVVSEAGVPTAEPAQPTAAEPQQPRAPHR